MTDRTWPSIEAFYDDDPRRRHSGECDYGVWWSEPEPDFPRYRVSYIEVTGEVYSVALRPGVDGPVFLLAVVPPDTGRCYYETLDALLDGWAEHCGPGGLSWVRERLAGWAP